jgi:hypothetical protein
MQQPDDRVAEKLVERLPDRRVSRVDPADRAGRLRRGTAEGDRAPAR